MMVTDDDAQENHENKDDEEEDSDNDDNNDDEGTLKKPTAIDSSTSWSPRISTHRLCPDLVRMVTIMMMMVRMVTNGH